MKRLGNPRSTSSPRPRARPPFEFALDELAGLHPATRPMFGAVAVYVGDRIVFCLREKESFPQDNGVWVATTVEHHESLRRELPSLRSIALLTADAKGDPGSRVTGWQVLPAD